MPLSPALILEALPQVLVDVYGSTRRDRMRLEESVCDTILCVALPCVPHTTGR